MLALIFLFDNIKITNKLLYVLFECICYFLIKEYHYKVSIQWNPKTDIRTIGLQFSSLQLLKYGEEKYMQFLCNFKTLIFKNHFRKVISGIDKENTNYLGNLLQELDTFLKQFPITEEYRDQVAEVIIELVGNACEHGNTDCLLDIDITNNYKKRISL